MKKCIVENRNVRILRRQRDSVLFLRLDSSMDKEGILKSAQKGIEYLESEDIVKSTNLQKFLLELNKGFTFVKR